MSINIKNESYYYNKENEERTKNRLIEIDKLWLSEVWIAEFWIPWIMSWLYIERIWEYSDDDFKLEIEWIKDLLKSKKLITKIK